MLAWRCRDGGVKWDILAAEGLRMRDLGNS